MAGESFVHRPETSLSDGVVGRQIGVIERYVLHVRRGRGGDVVVPQRNHRKILGQHFLRLVKSSVRFFTSVWASAAFRSLSNSALL